MHTEFIGQPYRRWPSGQSYVATALRDPRVTRLLIVSAWVRATGLKLLLPQLDAFRARGGRAEMVVGIDLKGTSWQGLELAREKFDSVHIVHDPGGGTFHPKVYLASGPSIAYALIGSNNQTPGGLVFNYEAALGCVFDPSQAPEVANDIASYVAELRDDRAICKRLTATFLRRLRDRGLLDDETQRTREDAPARGRARRRARTQGLFAPSEVEKRRPLPHRADQPAPALPPETAETTVAAPDTWWKRIGAGEAQRLSPTGHTTARIRLVNVPAGYARNTFFRDVFFGGEQWRGQRGAPREEAQITVEAELAGRSLGRHELAVIFHGPQVERGRATTDLWIAPLLSHLRATDVTGWYLVIERGTAIYRLLFTPTEPT